MDIDGEAFQVMVDAFDYTKTYTSDDFLKVSWNPFNELFMFCCIKIA